MTLSIPNFCGLEIMIGHIYWSLRKSLEIRIILVTEFVVLLIIIRL